MFTLTGQRAMGTVGIAVWPDQQLSGGALTKTRCVRLFGECCLTRITARIGLKCLPLCWSWNVFGKLTSLLTVKQWFLNLAKFAMLWKEVGKWSWDHMQTCGCRLLNTCDVGLGLRNHVRLFKVKTHVQMCDARTAMDKLHAWGNGDHR